MPSLHRHGTDRKGVGIFQQVFCNAKRADVYTSALLADAMKPLNVLSKFENHFAIRTVRFQVQLEADGYFSAQKFSSLQPQQDGTGAFIIRPCQVPHLRCWNVQQQMHQTKERWHTL